MEDKTTAIRFGEREITDSTVHPRKTQARHAAQELNGMYNRSTREISSLHTSDESVDEFGSAKTDKKDMKRMGKEQEMKVSPTRLTRRF